MSTETERPWDQGEAEAEEPSVTPGPRPTVDATAAEAAPPPPSARTLLLRALPACLLGWGVPGLGHAVLGRVGRGLAFGLIVLSLFVGGLALDGKVYEPVEGEPLTVLAAVGAAGVGVPFAVAHLGGFAAGDLESAYHDYGNTFTLVAGLLNLLIVLDVYDVALGRR